MLRYSPYQIQLNFRAFYKNKALLLFLLFNLSACVSANKKVKGEKISADQIKQMEQALSLIKQKEFVKAGSLYDQLSMSLKDPSAKILMLFNAGVSYKEAGECKKALLRQKSSLDHSLKKPEFKSRSLLELSYIYECLGDADMTLLILKDLEKFRQTLSWDLNHILYPARLSLAFAGQGNKIKANEYKSLSLRNVLRYKQKLSTKEEVKKQMSRLFYLMGRSYISKKQVKADYFLQSFFYNQLFILQSIFLQDKIWSKMAEKELYLLFDKLNLSIDQLKDKNQYKSEIKKALNTGKILVEKEKSKKWIKFL